MKNYYSILGVTPDSSEAEIKTAFRKLARKYHPDVNPDGAELFIDITEAYETLSNKKKKLHYDTINGFFKSSSGAEKQYTSPKKAQNEYSKKDSNKNFTEPNYNKNNFSKKINEIFEEFSKPCAQKKKFSPKNGNDIYEEVSINIKDALSGAERIVNVMHTSECPHCKGRKFINGGMCKVCGGSGEKVEHKKITVKRKQTITQDEFNELLEMIETHCTNKYDCFLIVSALKIMRYTGMRPSEVYALTKDDIDFKNHTIRVNKAVGSNSSEKYAVITTKTALSNRLIPYPSKLQIVLERLPEGFMFKRENGQLLNGDFVSDKIRIYSKGKYRAYMLRHQFSTDLITNNTDIRTVKELMGHSSDNMTIDYARSNDELKKEAVNKID